MRPWLEVPGDWRRPQAAGEFHLYWCDPHSFGQLHPRPTREQVRAFYTVGDYYTHQLAATRDKSGSRQPFGGKVLTHLAWHFDRGEPMTPAWFARLAGGRRLRCCDIGCGNGNLLERLRRVGCEAVGIETDEQARQVALDRGFDVLPGTAEELPAGLGHGSFDLVIMSHVAEHAIDPLRAISNAVALLRAGGLFVVECPNNQAMGCKADGVCWPWLDVPRHLNFFTPASLAEVCRRGGAEPQATEYCGYVRQFFPSWFVDQATIAGVLRAGGRRCTPADFHRRAWGLLARTALRQPERKYDSVRVIARRPA